jgi:hypothetical protein
MMGDPMTKHNESKRARRPPPESKEQTNPASSPRRPATRIEPRGTRLEDYGADYPTPPPEASGEDF